MKLEDFFKKLELALADKDTAEGLKSFGIEPEQLEGFKDLTIPTTLDEALKVREIQSEYDKRLGKAAQTREDNLKAKFNFVEKEDKKQPNEEEVKTDNTALKALMDKLSAMEKKLQEQEQEKQKLTIEQKRAEFAKNLKERGIPSVYVHELDLEKDFDSQFDAVSKKFEEEVGPIKNPGQRLPFPKNSGAKKPSKEEIAAIVG